MIKKMVENQGRVDYTKYGIIGDSFQRLACLEHIDFEKGSAIVTNEKYKILLDNVILKGIEEGEKERWPASKESSYEISMDIEKKLDLFLGVLCCEISPKPMSELDFLVIFNEYIKRSTSENYKEISLLPIRKIFTSPNIKQFIDNTLLYDPEIKLRDHEYVGADFSTLLGVYVMQLAEKNNLIFRNEGQVFIPPMSREAKALLNDFLSPEETLKSSQQ